MRAIDRLGNTDPTPASHAWTVDTLPPETAITDEPDDPSTSADASFRFIADEDGTTFECQLDGGGFSVSTSPRTYADLSGGPHAFEVRAVDSVGIPDPTPDSNGWPIDWSIFLPMVMN